MECPQQDVVGSQIQASSGSGHHREAGDQSKDLSSDSTYLECRSSSMHLDSTCVKTYLPYLNETLCELKVLLLLVRLHALSG